MQKLELKTRGISWPLRFTTLFVLFLATTLPAAAANHYVRSAATGNGSGSDWTNACTDFSGSCAVSSLVRGDTYYVATGSYGAYTWSRATSGTLVITIQRATASDHGTDTGWNAAYDGTVTWGDGQRVSTGYWTFDGQTATVISDPTTYGFFYNHASNCSTNDKIVSIGAPNVMFKNVAMITCGPSFDFAKWCFEITSGDNTLISHAYCQYSVDFVQTNGSQSNATYEYIYTKNNGGTASNHGEVYQLVCNGCTIRYNWFEDCASTACISGNAGTAPGASNLIPLFNTQIYGNVFNNVNAGNGIIHASGSTGIAGTLFYNNTIVNQVQGPWFDECAGHTCPSGSGNNVLINNIIWNGNCSMGIGLGGDGHDYNTYLSCKSGSAPSEAHGQTGSSNPFVNSAGNDFHLAAAGTAGSVLPSPYNVDYDGNVRGGDGTWDRGAYEFNASSTARPQPPTGLTAIVN